MSGQHNLQTIIGYIVTVPGGEAEDGSRISIHTDNGEEYFITPKGMGLDLMEHVNARAEVHGMIEVRDDAKFITVRTYNVQDGFEDDWYDDKE